MANDSNHTSNNFLALLFGVVVGVGVTYCLTTKEGRRILAKFKKSTLNFLGSLDETLESYNIIDNNFVKNESERENQNESTTSSEEDHHYIEELQNRGRLFGKRFFKRH